jgi:hypothetical protein
MSRTTRLILKILSALAFVALVVVFFLFLKDNQITKENRLIRKAKDEYYQREFVSAYATYKILFDSLNFEDDAALLNYGNAAFMSSSILKNGMYGGRQSNKQPQPDSVLKNLANTSQDIYLVLTASDKNKLASMAHNQLGYSAIKSSFAANASDSILLQSLNSFKEALKADPANDSARYNYELIKKIIGFPETILAQTKSLVAQHRYVEAANLLEKSMARDIRLKNQQDFLNRIKSIAGIDTTFTKKRK